MPYKKHNLAVQNYPVNEYGHPILPDHCAWRVYNHLGEGRFETILDSGGDPCLILEDPELNFWPVMSFLLPEEAVQLAERLREMAEGSRGQKEEKEASESRYEKHNLAIWKYDMVEPGRVTPPDYCRWVVRKHQGNGKFTSQPDSPGYPCLILEDTENNFSPAMSFLTPAEALELSARLLRAVESVHRHRAASADHLLTTHEAADILAITPRQVTRLIRQGQIEASRFGKVYMLARAEVERYQRERNPRGRPPVTTLKDTMALTFDDETGGGWKLPFSIIRRTAPHEVQGFEKAIEKLAEAVDVMSLEAIDYACSNFLSKKEELIETLRNAMVKIPPYLEENDASGK